MPSAGPPRTGRPLDGRTVVVTRSRAQASSLVVRLGGLGASTVELPVIAVTDPPDGGAALRAAADRLAGNHYDWMAVTSANAVARLASALDGRPVGGTVRVAAVGPATSRALAGAGVGTDLVPDRATGDDLAAAFPEAPDTGGTVLVPRAEVVRGALADGLRAKGWTVDEVVAYRTVGGEPDPAAVGAARRADAVAFTSSSTVERTLDLLGSGGLPPVVVTIGPVTSAAARAAGLEVAAEATEPTIDGVAAALVAVLAGDPRRPRQQ